MIIDADTILAREALSKLVVPFLNHPRLGAVTANPIPLRRTGFWGHLQAAEFASIIGLIKRGQRSYGRLFTAGLPLMTGWRCKGRWFSACTATESTYLETAPGREIWFEPEAVAYIQNPNTFIDLWKQRCRWATGGWHMLRSHAAIFFKWRYRRLWPVYLEFALGCLWAISLIVNLGLAAFTVTGFTLLLHWFGPVVCSVCMIQMGAAYLLNSRYDRTWPKVICFCPSPLVYYVLVAAAVVWLCPADFWQT